MEEKKKEQQIYFWWQNMDRKYNEV